MQARQQIKLWLCAQHGYKTLLYVTHTYSYRLTIKLKRHSLNPYLF